MRHAYALARANAGAPGADGMTFAASRRQGLEAWLAGLREELVSKTYRPDPVRRVMIRKAGWRRATARHSDVGCIMHLAQFGFGDGGASRGEFATQSRSL